MAPDVVLLNSRISVSADDERIFVCDGHGNVRALTNTAGAVTDTYQFDAFRSVIASTGTTANSYLCSGEHFDNAAGHRIQTLEEQLHLFVSNGRNRERFRRTSGIIRL